MLYGLAMRGFFILSIAVLVCAELCAQAGLSDCGVKIDKSQTYVHEYLRLEMEGLVIDEDKKFSALDNITDNIALDPVLSTYITMYENASSASDKRQLALADI